MSGMDFSLLAIGEELLSVTWPALLGLCGVQVMTVRRALAETTAPSKSLVAIGTATAMAACAAIAISIGYQIRSMPQPESGFSEAGFLWTIFSTTMWPVVVALGFAEVVLVASARSSSRGLTMTAALSSGLTTTWITAWWLYVAPHSPVVVRLLSRRLWLLGVAAAGLGFVVSTTTLMIGRRRARRSGQ